MGRADRVETVAHLKDLVADPHNRRKHNPRNVGMVSDALRAVGAARSIVIDEYNVVLAGNGVTEAAAEAGITKVQVVEADGNTLVAVRRRGLTAAQKRALAIYDNRTAELAEWDVDQLAADQADGLDLATFWTASELDDLLDAGPTAGLTDPDDVPDVPEDPITKPGDLWLLGDHRLLCCDSADPRQLVRLLGGQTPNLTVVDPPYDMSDAVWSRWIADPSIVFGQMKQMRMIPSAWWRFERVIVKGYRHRSATVQIDHRHAFVAQVGSDKVLPHSSETFPSVVDQGTHSEHDHQKPVSLLIEHMTQWSPAWTIVLDPFAGSGSTLIAAEQLGRTCYGMEISPSYCDVIVQRWEAFTGRKAVKSGQA